MGVVRSVKRARVGRRGQRWAWRWAAGHLSGEVTLRCFQDAAASTRDTAGTRNIAGRGFHAAFMASPRRCSDT
eukprot:363785-Chlamydomonas_euryale.AAC.3